MFVLIIFSVWTFFRTFSIQLSASPQLSSSLQCPARNLPPPGNPTGSPALYTLSLLCILCFVPSCPGGGGGVADHGEGPSWRPVCLPLWLHWVLTFLSFCRALKQAGTKAAATAPGWEAEQWPWGHRPEDRANRNGVRGQGSCPPPPPPDIMGS